MVKSQPARRRDRKQGTSYSARVAEAATQPIARATREPTSSVADRGALAKPTRAEYRWRSRSPMGATRRDETREESPRGQPSTGDKTEGRPREPWNGTMLPKSALSASDRKKWGKQAVGVGQHRVLLALWDHAHGWRTGSGDWFVWPAVATIATCFGLTDDAVRRCLRELAARGWIRSDTSDGRRGWWLRETPPSDPPQLELFASIPSEPGAVDNLGTDTDNHRAERDGSLDNHRVATSTGTEGTVSEAREHDDDAARIWTTYETDRARMLPSSPPPRTGPAPLALRALIAEIGLPRVDTYARRSLELAADAVARDRQCAATLVLARSDGHEWHVRRVEAVERFPDPPCAPIVVARPPPAEIVLDGRPLDRWEREAHVIGGDDAVRAMRAAPALTGDAAARMLREGAPWLRIAGGVDHV